MRGTAAVVGAGIGGLTAAAALCQQGWSVRVFERAEALERTGAGIGIAPNGLRVLDLVGAGDAVRTLAALHGDGGVRRADGGWLAKSSAEAMTRQFGMPVVVARRSDVVEILDELLPAGTLALGRRVLDVSPGDDGRPARLTVDDETVDADLVVCADGIRSLGRSTLFAGYPAPRYSGSTSWRTVVPSVGQIKPAETWGQGRLFGAMPLTGGEVYCYAMAYAPAGEGAEGGQADRLRRLFAGWHEPIPELLADAEDADVLRNDVYHLPVPLPPFHRGRVALLGDAAHAMTPNLGQGACQAMEDAAVLAHRLTVEQGSVPAALAAYAAERRPRTTRLVRQSGRMMRVAQLSTAPARRARDVGMAGARVLTADLAARLFFAVAGWRPPQQAGTT